MPTQDIDLHTQLVCIHLHTCFFQLFINHRLKSVAHLPMKALMYKAFNTFIDDVFAFLIHMPTLHRVACFRDDIVFIIYMYQVPGHIPDFLLGGMV